MNSVYAGLPSGFERLLMVGLYSDRNTSTMPLNFPLGSRQGDFLDVRGAQTGKLKYCDLGGRAGRGCRGLTPDTNIAGSKRSGLAALGPKVLDKSLT